jgi:hypothetical protein
MMQMSKNMRISRGEAITAIQRGGDRPTTLCGSPPFKGAAAVAVQCATLRSDACSRVRRPARGRRGNAAVRREVADFIQRRDGHPSNPEVGSRGRPRSSARRTQITHAHVGCPGHVAMPVPLPGPLALGNTPKGRRLFSPPLLLQPASW